jgi:hypothetical protein
VTLTTHLSLGVMRSDSDTDHPPPSTRSAAVKNEYSCTSTPPIYLPAIVLHKAQGRLAFLHLYGGSDLDLLRVIICRLVTVKCNDFRLLANTDHLTSSINLHSTFLEILSLFVVSVCVSYHSQN